MNVQMNNTNIIEIDKEKLIFQEKEKKKKLLFF